MLTTPQGRVALHAQRPMSAALIAEMDRLMWEGRLYLMYICCL
jgi:hypothetical protein